MLGVPTGERNIIKFANDLIEQCNHSQATRAAFYRAIHRMVITGRQDGTPSLLNLLHNHLDRLAAHLFSPTDLRFTIDFENEYPKNILDRAGVVARILTRDFERSNTDMIFGQGVYEACKYGACILKQWPQVETADEIPVYHKRLLMPWQFGVYREDENEIGKQPALCETSHLTLPEVWRRIYHLPNAEDLFKKIKTHAQRGSAGDQPNSFMHQVLSTSQINTSGQQQANPSPGGIVQFAGDPNYVMMGPQLDVDLVKLYELWVMDEDDYTTIQIVEPDILIAPRFKKTNLLVPGDANSLLQPYTVIQPNVTSGYFWGNSDIVDLIEPQGLLSVWADDAKRLLGLQIDKIIGFQGDDGITDEIYDEMRSAGYLKTAPGSTITDLTPKFPPELLPMMKFLIEQIGTLGGFPAIMQGQGEAGVRAGSHANTLLKTGSPRLRDRALLVERQCATAADLRLELMIAKDPRNYWSRGDKIDDVEKTKFLLSDLPEDRRVSVDSHSSSPIFADDHANLIGFGLKGGFVNGHYAIDHLQFPDKEILHAALREKEQKEAELIKQHPELLEAMFKKKMGGGRR